MLAINSIKFIQLMNTTCSLHSYNLDIKPKFCLSQGEVVLERTGDRRLFRSRIKISKSILHGILKTYGIFLFKKRARLLTVTSCFVSLTLNGQLFVLCALLP